MIVVTGGAGFIGSNIVKQLNKQGRQDILVVDELSDGRKFKNIADCDISDYMDCEDFLSNILSDDESVKNIEVIFHEGACSETTEWDGQYMMQNNYEYSKSLLHYCLEKNIPFIYASSAATYGANTTFIEERKNELPLNVYGYSKFLFDEYVRRILSTAKSQIVGTRYFNVYGPRECHKESMASVAFHLNDQMKENGVVKLFEGTDGYENGGQLRDFIFVEDAVAVNLWFWQHPDQSGIFNVGTGKAQPFNDIAKAVVAWYGKGNIEYISFPEKLKGCYQSFTEADLTKLRATGCDHQFKTVEEGVKIYLDWLNK